MLRLLVATFVAVGAVCLVLANPASAGPPRAGSGERVYSYDAPSTIVRAFPRIASAVAPRRAGDPRPSTSVLAVRLAAEAGGGAVKLLGPGTSYGAKIEKQLGKRGWTKRFVDSTIDDLVRTVRTRDTRHLPGGGRADDPATAYYSGRGGYIVRNDRTGDIIQVSDRTDPGWKAPWGS